MSKIGLEPKGATILGSFGGLLLGVAIATVAFAHCESSRPSEKPSDKPEPCRDFLAPRGPEGCITGTGPLTKRRLRHWLVVENGIAMCRCIKRELKDKEQRADERGKQDHDPVRP
jgi:hypothetical protein